MAVTAATASELLIGRSPLGPARSQVLVETHHGGLRGLTAPRLRWRLHGAHLDPADADMNRRLLAPRHGRGRNRFGTGAGQARCDLSRGRKRLSGWCGRWFGGWPGRHGPRGVRPTDQRRRHGCPRGCKRFRGRWLGSCLGQRGTSWQDAGRGAGRRLSGWACQRRPWRPWLRRGGHRLRAQARSGFRRHGRRRARQRLGLCREL